MQHSEYLVRGDMEEAKGGSFVSIQFVPPNFGGAQKRTRSKDVGTHKGFRIDNRTVHMAFGGKVDHGVWLVGFKQMLYKLSVADVTVHKNMPRITGQ